MHLRVFLRLWAEFLEKPVDRGDSHMIAKWKADENEWS